MEMNNYGVWPILNPNLILHIEAIDFYANMDPSRWFVTPVVRRIIEKRVCQNRHILFLYKMI